MPNRPYARRAMSEFLDEIRRVGRGRRFRPSRATSPSPASRRRSRSSATAGASRTSARRMPTTCSSRRASSRRPSASSRWSSIYRLGTGRLAEVFGELSLPMDRFVRTVGLEPGRTPDRREERRPLARDRDGVPVGRAGVAAEMPPRRSSTDSSAASSRGFPVPTSTTSWPRPVVFMAWSLSGNWDTELLRVEIAERLGWEGAARPVPRPGRAGGPVIAGNARRRRTAPAALDLLRQAPDLPEGAGLEQLGGERRGGPRPESRCWPTIPTCWRSSRPSGSRCT